MVVYRVGCNGRSSHIVGMLVCMLDGQFLQPPSRTLTPQPIHLLGWLAPDKALTTSVWPWISARDFLAASKPQHLVMVWSSLRSLVWRRSCTVSPSDDPSIIGLRTAFLQAFCVTEIVCLASSLRHTRKSSKDSPGCCLRGRGFLHSTISLICTST